MTASTEPARARSGGLVAAAQTAARGGEPGQVRDQGQGAKERGG